MRRAVDINPGKRTAIESIHHFGKAPIQRNMASQLNGALGFKTVCPAGTLEFVTAVIRDVDLFIRAVNQEEVAAQREPIQIERRSRLVEIGSRNPRRFWPLNHPTSVLACDPSPVVEMQ